MALLPGRCRPTSVERKHPNVFGNEEHGRFAGKINCPYIIVNEQLILEPLTLIKVAAFRAQYAFSEVRLSERVYIIDGGGNSGVSLSFTLSTVGFDPLFYPRLSLFLAQAEEAPPACILVDVDCPGDGKLEIVRDLRARLDWPVIAVSTADDPGLAAQALAAGADDFVAAPFAAADLVPVIRAAAVRLERAAS